MPCSGGWIRTTTVRINSPLPCRWATPDRACVARTGLEPARVPGENRVTLPFRPPRPVALLIACRGGRRGRTATGRNPNRFRDGGRRRLSAGSSRGATSVSPGGVEPPTFALSERRSHLLSYGELHSANSPAPTTGIEPAALRSTGGRSTTELRRHRSSTTASGYGELNPGVRLGKAAHCRCATATSSVRGSNPVFRIESPMVYPPQPHGRFSAHVIHYLIDK